MQCQKLFDSHRLPCKAKEPLGRAGLKLVKGGESLEGVATGLGLN